MVFSLDDCRWSAGSAVTDFFFGWLYVLDILVNLRTGFVVQVRPCACTGRGRGLTVKKNQYKGSRRLELGTLRAAAYYVRHGTFFVDLFATLPVFAQTVCLASPVDNTSLAINITQTLRLLRLLRLVRALRLIMGNALDVAGASFVRVADGAFTAYLQVLQIFILFGFTTNLMACAWVYTAITEGALCRRSR